MNSSFCALLITPLNKRNDTYIGKGRYKMKNTILRAMAFFGSSMRFHDILCREEKDKLRQQHIYRIRYQ